MPQYQDTITSQRAVAVVVVVYYKRCSQYANRKRTHKYRMMKERKQHQHKTWKNECLCKGDRVKAL